MNRTHAPALALIWVLTAATPAGAQDFDPDELATYSIIARDPMTGELGMGVQSKAFAAGNRAMHAKGGVAVIAHQASANPMYGAVHFSGEIIRTANELRGAGDLAGALAAAFEARDRSPDNDNAWVALATVQLEMGRDDQMIESLARAVELNPGRRTTLPTDTNFETVWDDVRFRGLIGGPR